MRKGNGKVLRRFKETTRCGNQAVARKLNVKRKMANVEREKWGTDK